MPKQLTQGRILQKVLTASLKRPWAFIVLFVLVTGFFGWGLPRLAFRTSIYDLAVEDLPATQYFEKFKKDFGSEEIILVVARAGNVFDPVTFASIEEIAKQLAAIEGVRRVVSLPDIRNDMDVTKKWAVEDFERIVGPVELFKRNFLSADKKATVISLLLHDNCDRKAVLDAVDAVIAAPAPGVSTIYQIGMPSVAQALASYTEKDFRVLPPVTFAIILVVLYALFGTWRGVLVPAGSVAIALVWTMGLMAWTGIALSLMTMIVPVFLIAVGTAYCMHVISEHYASAREAALPREAVYLCFSRVGFPSTLAVITTVVGLASLLINKIEGIREFAVFSCFGMLSLLAVILLLLPAVLSLLPLPEKQTRGFARPALDRFLEAIVHINLTRQKIVLPVLAVITVISAVGALFVKVETNPVDYFKKNTEISQRFYDIYRDMAGSFPVNVVLDSKVDGYFEEPANLAKITAIQDQLTTYDGVDKSIAFADFLKMINYATNEYDKQYYALPAESYEVRMLTNTYKSMLGLDMYSRFMDTGMSRANIMLRTHLSSSQDFFVLKDRISRFLEDNYAGDMQFKITGLGMVIAESSDVLTSSQIKSLSMTMAVIFGIMLLMFLSGKVGLAAMATNIFPIVLCFGFMGWTGIKLSVVTSLIASIAIGLAVDDTIHYLVRYNREFKKDLDKDRALRDTVKGVGPPMVFTTLTICAGFAVLLLSHFQPTSVFGVLMIITMIAALAGDIIFLPAIMLHVELVTAWDLMSLIPSLGGISPGIAHELRQPLNAVKIGGEFVQTMLERGEKIPEEDLKEVIQQINEQVNRASDYIDRLADFGRKPSGPFEKISINAPVRDTLALTGKQLALENITLEVELEENLPPIMGHRNRIGQVLFNLLANAVESINRKAADGPEDRERRISVRTFLNRDSVVLSVADTGAGIEEHIRDRIMEPFFTTKQEGRGMGLGLSISREIVRDYRGRLDFFGYSGKGAVFKVLFPRADI